MFIFNICFILFEMEIKIIFMNKLVIFKDYLVDKFDNVLLVKNKKKRGGGRLEKNMFE